MKPVRVIDPASGLGAYGEVVHLPDAEAERRIEQGHVGPITPATSGTQVQDPAPQHNDPTPEHGDPSPR